MCFRPPGTPRRTPPTPSQVASGGTTGGLRPLATRRDIEAKREAVETKMRGRLQEPSKRPASTLVRRVPTRDGRAGDDPRAVRLDRQAVAGEA